MTGKTGAIWTSLISVLRLTLALLRLPPSWEHDNFYASRIRVWGRPCWTRPRGVSDPLIRESPSLLDFCDAGVCETLPQTPEEVF